MKYPERMRALREDHDYTQTEIANVLGIAQTTYSQYELAKRSLPIEYLITLCQFYHVSTDYMLGLTDKKKHPPSFSSPLYKNDTELLSDAHIQYSIFFGEFGLMPVATRLYAEISLYFFTTNAKTPESFLAYSFILMIIALH